MDKTMLDVMEVGEWVSGVRGPIRRICATIFNLRRFEFVMMFHLPSVLGKKTFWLFKSCL